jgi:hypothetical protein
MRHFAKYSLLVIKQWESWVGIVALVFFAASRFRGHEFLIPDWIWLAILAGLLYYATFEVYLAARKNVPKPGEIKVALKSVETGGGGSWSGGIPPCLPQIAARIDLTNLAPEAVRLVDFRVERCEPGGASLSCAPVQMQCIGPSGGGKIPSHWEIPGNAYRQLLLHVPINVKASDLKSFVETIRDAEAFQMSFVLNFEDNYGNKNEHTVELKGDYDRFRDELLNQQLKKREPELAFLLLDAENRFRPTKQTK